jgi:tetratricopeptide (TPR) repeat protein
MVNQPIRLLTLLIISTLILSACAREKSVSEYLQDGRKHLESGDLSKAIAALEEALKREPGLAEAHRLLGEALGRSDRWPEAVTQFEAYLTLSEGDAAVYYLLGQAQARTGDLKKAASSFAQGASIDPSFLTSHGEEVAEATEDFLQAGKEALKAGDLATANELLTIIAPLVTGQGDVYLSLGQAHQQANDTVQALLAYANAVKMNPELADERADEIDALAQQGSEMSQLALEAGDLATAVQVTEALVTLLPDEPEAHFLMGNVYNQANRFDQAIEQYQTVLRLDPDSSSAHTNMGVVHYKMGDLETAIREYQAALQIEPDDAETHYLLGAAHIQTEQLEQGKAEFKAALALDDQLAPSYIGLGNVYLLQGDLEQAREMSEQAVMLSPNSPEAYFLQGQVYIQLGNITQARAALERMLSLNPSPHWREQAEQILAGLGSE